jgi:hypothetical protein
MKMTRTNVYLIKVEILQVEIQDQAY